MVIRERSYAEAVAQTLRLADWLEAVGPYGLMNPTTGEVMVSDAALMSQLLHLMLPADGIA